MVYDIDTKHKYVDTYLSGNLIQKINADSYNDMAASSWYGEKNYYDQKLF